MLKHNAQPRVVRLDNPQVNENALIFGTTLWFSLFFREKWRLQLSRVLSELKSLKKYLLP